MTVHFYPPRGRQLVIDEIIAHLQFAMETDDLEYTEYLCSLIHHHEIIRHLDELHPLRVYLMSLGHFKPKTVTYQKKERKEGEKFKRMRVNRSFNPQIN